ncbi:MAG: response regulator transcription factor [Leptospiraceae bacterium]|nr:response regulator transcription factor [Leptospiraceae bacterium]
MTEKSSLSGKKHPVLIADDHQLILTGLQIVIGESDSFYVCSAGRSGEDVYTYLKEKVPRIAVLDIGMASGEAIRKEVDPAVIERIEKAGLREPTQYGGLLVVSWLKARYPDLGILIITQQESPQVIAAAAELQVDGVMLKDDVNENILPALSRIVEGNPVFSEKVKAILAQHGENSPKLSDREWEVFELVAHGFKDKEIAERLDISARTVAFHKGNIKEKLNAETTAELIAYFHEKRR